MHVTKLVDIVTRIPKQLSLHFSDFSTNLYRFYKLAVFGNKKKNKNKTDSRIYTPGRFWGIANRSLPELTGEGLTLGAEIRRGHSPAAKGKWGNRIRGSR